MVLFGKKRTTRTLSLEGCELFNIGVNCPVSPTSPKPCNLPCLKSLLLNLFTTDFDIKLEKSKKSFRKGTCSLYAFLTEEQKKKIPDFFNNAVTNLVYLILVDGNKINNKQKIRHNISFYYSLASLAFENGDHNTVILLKAALENTAIRRLKLKPLKKQKELTQKFEKVYGTFMNCNAGHLKQMLENDDREHFLPSIVIMLMHLNKTKEYAKCYQSIGKFPEALQNKHNQIQKLADSYYDNYKTFQNKIIDLYLKDPMDLKYMKESKGMGISGKLFEISLLVDGKKIKKQN